MFVQHRTDFIHQLRQCDDLSDFDQIFLKKVGAVEHSLPELDGIDWIAVFSERWTSVADTHYDYMFNPKGSNECWIKFAHRLARETDRTYLQILIPVATNTYDPVLIERVTDYTKCSLHILSTRPAPTEKKYVYSYVFLEQEQQLFYIAYNGIAEIIEIDSAYQSRFSAGLLAMMNGKKYQQLSGNQFNALIDSNGGYPRFDLRNLYLGEDGHTLQRTRGLVSRIQNGLFPLSTFKDHTTTEPRALTLRELFRIRSKVGDLYFDSAKQTYSSVWDCIKKSQMPGWQTHGEYPSHLLPALMALIDLYFTSAENAVDRSQFRQQLLLWSEKLQYSCINDVNYLYGKRIVIGTETVYLLDILLDCLQVDPSKLNAKLLSVAQWLCEYDASLIGDSLALRNLYKERSVGPCFGVAKLKQMLAKLNAEQFPDIKRRIVSLSTSLDESRGIEARTIDALSQIYTQRWAHIQNTALDYRQLDKGINKPWIALAQLLSGARTILPTNYICFLMPTLRPQSFAELSKLRSMHGSLYFDFLNNTYENSRRSLRWTTVITWQKNAEIPRHVLQDILALVDVYFMETSPGGNLNSLRKTLDDVALILDDCAIDDLNCLYVTPVKISDKHVYFIDILLDLFDALKQPVFLCSVVLNEKIKGIAAWLCMYDASFVSKHEALHDTYQRLGVGSSFGVQQLIPILMQLKLDCSSPLSERIELLSRSLENKDAIDFTVLDALCSIYQQRWRDVKGTNLDYLRQQNGINRQWILLAQRLNGAGYFSGYDAHLITEASETCRETFYSNYYFFLMPTLKQVMDPIQKDSIVNFDLSHYILADDSCELILLDNCENVFKSVRSFYHSNKRLTDTELARIGCASRRFHPYIELARYVEQDLSIQLSTVLAIKDLVDESLYTGGLVRGQSYTASQMDVAHAAYDKYIRFYKSLPEDERCRLNEQRILFFGKNNSFADTLDQSWYCMAVSSQRFAQLVMDYAPYLHFATRIEISGRCDIASMRKFTRGKLFRDPELIAQKAQVLFVSLMTQTFPNYFEASEFLSVWDCSNKVDSVAGKIFAQLIPMVKSGDFSDAPQALATIIDSLVKPALADISYVTTLTRSANTVAWLQSISDGSLFTNESGLHEPSLLLKALTPLAFEKRPYSAVISQFIDDFLRSYIEPNHDILLKMRVNIKLVKLLESLDGATRLQILNALKTAHPSVDARSFHQNCANFLMKRLNSLTSSQIHKSKSGRFFAPSVDLSESVVQQIDDAGCVRQVVDIFDEMVKASPKAQEKTVKLEYLQKLKGVPSLTEAAVNLRAFLPRSGTF